MKKNRLLFISLRGDTGKTSIILGLIKSADKKCGYIKPLGDRLLYKKKRLWDHDVSLLTKVFGWEENPENMTIGFDHSKLRYMYDGNSIDQKFNEMAHKLEEDNELVFIEGGKNFTFGTSVNLDAIHLATLSQAQTVIVVSGNSDAVIDDLTYIKKYLAVPNVLGVIINKINDLDDFKNSYLKEIDKLDLKILGMIPYQAELSELSVEQVSDSLLAKVIAGSEKLTNRVSHIDVGAMSINEIIRENILNKKNNLIITSGDRVDIILAALGCDPSGIVLTNNILPPSHIIAHAAEKNVPLMTVPTDTFETAKKVDDIAPLLFPKDHDKFDLLEKMISQYVSLR